MESILKAVAAKLFSRKLFVAILGILTAGSVAKYPQFKEAILAIAGIASSYILGQGYVDGKAAENVSPAAQNALIQNLAVQLANKLVASKANQVNQVLQGVSQDAPQAPTAYPLPDDPTGASLPPLPPFGDPALAGNVLDTLDAETRTKVEALLAQGKS